MDIVTSMVSEDTVTVGINTEPLVMNVEVSTLDATVVVISIAELVVNDMKLDDTVDSITLVIVDNISTLDDVKVTRELDVRVSCVLSTVLVESILGASVSLNVSMAVLFDTTSLVKLTMGLDC